jgi:hypothetical protein
MDNLARELSMIPIRVIRAIRGYSLRNTERHGGRTLQRGYPSITSSSRFFAMSAARLSYFFVNS